MSKNTLITIIASAIIFGLLLGFTHDVTAVEDCGSYTRADILKTNHDSAQRIKEAVTAYIESEQEIWADEAGKD